MQTITTIRLDIAKSVFQIHGVDAAGRFWPILLQKSVETSGEP
jgi:hypothetical protein